jgi:hypothetical protein
MINLRGNLRGISNQVASSHLLVVFLLFAVIFHLNACGDGDGEPCCGILDCLREDRSHSFTSEELTSIGSEIKDCFDCDITDWTMCLPFNMGTDSRNDMDLEVNWTCADICPTYTFVYIRYENVHESYCQDLGGVEVRTPGWNKYVGCAPPENPTIWRFADECE